MWMGLVDILEENQYVCERDWKDEKADFVYFLQNLAGIKRLELKIDANWLDEDGSVPDWCALLEEKWKTKHVQMVAIDIDSDSYVIFPCQTACLTELKQLAADMGRKIDLAKNM